jgi:hypothetical protein
MRTKFQDLPAYSEKDVVAALLRDDPDELQFVSITIALGDLDFGFTQSVCVRLAANADSRVRANGLVSLGHLARRFRRLDEPAVKPLVEAGLRDNDELVRISSKSAADEIHQLLHWTISGHTYG